MPCTMQAGAPLERLKYKSLIFLGQYTCTRHFDFPMLLPCFLSICRLFVSRRYFHLKRGAGRSAPLAEDSNASSAHAVTFVPTTMHHGRIERQAAAMPRLPMIGRPCFFHADGAILLRQHGRLASTAIARELSAITRDMAAISR